MNERKINDVPEAIENRKTDAHLINLLFKFAVLMEYQLLDLQFAVRKFVEEMNESIMKLDAMVTEEGKHASSLFESIFNETQKESEILNKRAADRVDNIIEELLASGVEGIDESLVASLKGEEGKSDIEILQNEELPQEARDAVWSKMSKKLESVARLEDRLRPQVYSLITCLNFEDIQTQRLDHLLKGYKTLNEALVKYLKEGEGNLPGGNVEEFSKKFMHYIKSMYTMEDERRIFDQVFNKNKDSGKKDTTKKSA